MLSANEWDPLKEVIVGRADYAKIPPLDISLRTVNYANVKELSNIPHGLYPQQVIEEANEDLEIFANYLTGQGIIVHRPNFVEEPKYYNYCPRDSALVLKDITIETPMPLRCRDNENINLRHLFDSTNHVILTAERHDDCYDINCIGNPNVLALTEREPLFDAANILRDDNNLYYLVSNSGNLAGASLLSQVIGTKYKVWPIERVYSYMHLDSTIALLRKGLMLLNPERIKSVDQLPKPLQEWEAIWCPQPVDIGHHPGYCNASKWINMNLFSINPNLVVLEENQIPLAEELAKYGIESQLLPMRQQRTLGGGFHCVTLDLVRE
jgi:N-dimethylarginine dimethylaminohydrolase